MDGFENDAPGTPTFAKSLLPIPLLCAVLTGVAPGVKVSSCVKFRPLSGRSSTTFTPMTVPSSEVDCCSCSACAATSMVSVTSPT